jgi:uncharacterized protein (TIGR00290 family)
MRAGAKPLRLITMMIEGGERSHSHGIARPVLEAQAESMGIPIAFESASWNDYEVAFRRLVQGAVGVGARSGVFGDIDIDRHRRWVERVCGLEGASARFPLWKRERSAILRDLIDRGFAAIIVAIRDGALPTSLLGQRIDRAMLRRFADAGIDLAGENGEYHTLLVDGPIFREPLPPRLGESSLRDGVWFIDVGIEGRPMPG